MCCVWLALQLWLEMRTKSLKPRFYGGGFGEFVYCGGIGLIEGSEAAVEPFVDLGVLDTSGFGEVGYSADFGKEFGLCTRELTKLDVMMCGDAAVFAYVVDEAADGFNVLGECGLIGAVGERVEGTRDHEGGMSAGDKALDDIHSFGNG